MLYRWFIGLAMNEAVWVPTVFTKNRERLLEHDAVIELFNHVLQSADKQGWLSGERLSVDGTLIPKLGRATKALCARTAATATRAAAASGVKAVQTERTNRALTVTPGCTARARQPASCVLWATR